MPPKAESRDLSNFIKYCLAYIRLTGLSSFAAQQRKSLQLPDRYFSLAGLLNGDLDGSVAELIRLDTFYQYTPRTVPDELKAQYEQEKALANSIEEVYNRHKNDQFTKQVILNFGHFEVELPLDPDAVLGDEEGEDGDNEFPLPTPTRFDKFPLFSLPVRIEKEIAKGVGRYSVVPIDDEVQVNSGALEAVLGTESYFQLLEKVGNLELSGRLNMPFQAMDAFLEVWNTVKALLKLREARFGDESFSLTDMRLVIAAKANYFLADDLHNLAKLDAEKLSETALGVWTSDEGLCSAASEQEADVSKTILFPFPHDKYQARVVSLLGQSASIVQGPPGTGKSETIANLLCHLAANGKRVLFVSQKAQALKVVKDKLKRLNLKYLYGYLPNLASAQLDQQDETDGVAAQLAAIGTHIEKIRFARAAKALADLGEASKATQSLKRGFDGAVETERRAWKLSEELKALQSFDLDVRDLGRFSRKFGPDVLGEILTMQERVADLTRWVKEFEAPAGIEISLEAEEIAAGRYSAALSELLDDLKRTAYDRHSAFGRLINNSLRNFRQRSARAKFPREIVDLIDGYLKKDVSRREAVDFVGKLHLICLGHERRFELEHARESLKAQLGETGLIEKQFDRIAALMKSEGVTAEKLRAQVVRISEIRDELQKLGAKDGPNAYREKLRKARVEFSAGIARHIQTVIDSSLGKKWEIPAVRRVIMRLSKAFGKSKKAFKTFDRLRKEPENFKTVLDLIPIWIMELDDASRIVPFEPGLFDYVILDEASQCNVAFTLPVMFRAKRALFVGDSEQMRDSTVMFKSNRAFDEMAARYKILETLQIKASGSAVQSVLDIATLRGFQSVPLRCHYRSPRELIGFSNLHFYKPKGKELIAVNNNYLPFGETNRVLLVHHVPQEPESETLPHTSFAEAKAIVAMVQKLRADRGYKGKSIGVLSFFNAQAALIRRMLEEAGFSEEEHDYKVSIVEGIQGDEKDIVLYSFVIRSPEQRKRYFPLTGERGDIRADINRGRVNVAFSRARLQAHCFTSLPTEEIPEGIWLKRYAEYARDNGEIRTLHADLQPFDSGFEESFFQEAQVFLGSGFKITNQVKSCGFRIDFVVTNTRTGKRVAVECDGPTHFRDEVDEEFGLHVEGDEERQAILEAAGWAFYRIGYSSWLLGPEARRAHLASIRALLI